MSSCPMKSSKAAEPGATSHQHAELWEASGVTGQTALHVQQVSPPAFKRRKVKITHAKGCQGSDQAKSWSLMDTRAEQGPSKEAKARLGVNLEKVGSRLSKLAGSRSAKNTNGSTVTTGALAQKALLCV